MSIELDNVDELEALLGELDGGTTPAPVTDADVVDAEIISDTAAEPAAAPKKRTPRKPLKPLPAEVAAEAAADADAALDDLSDLSALEGLEDAVTTPAPSVTATDDLDLAALEGLDEVEEPGVGAGGALADAGLLHPGAIVLDKAAMDKIKNPEATLAAAGLKVATVVEAPAELKEAVKADVAAEAAERADADADLAALVDEATAAPVAAASKPIVTAGVGVGVAHSSVGKASPTILDYVPTKPLKTFIDEVRLQEDLSFSTNNLSMAMTRQAALFAHYARLAAEATYQADRAKQQVELVEAELDQTIRDTLTTAGTKFTEAMVKSMIIKDGSYQAAQSRAFEAKAIAKMVGTAAESFDHRKDMLIQVGADSREEKKGQMRMKEHPGEAAVRGMQEQQS